MSGRDDERREEWACRMGTTGTRESSLQGDERDRIYAEQARRYSGFADYAQRTAGIRTIPVLELKR
jgi:hypothetical protein